MRDALGTGHRRDTCAVPRKSENMSHQPVSSISLASEPSQNSQPGSRRLPVRRRRNPGSRRRPPPCIVDNWVLKKDLRRNLLPVARCFPSTNCRVPGSFLIQPTPLSVDCGIDPLGGLNLCTTPASTLPLTAYSSSVLIDHAAGFLACQAAALSGRRILSLYFLLHFTSRSWLGSFSL